MAQVKVVFYAEGSTHRSTPTIGYDKCGRNTRVLGSVERSVLFQLLMGFRAVPFIGERCSSWESRLREGVLCGTLLGSIYVLCDAGFINWQGQWPYAI